MKSNLIAKASATIDASVAKVWNALVNPEAVKQYMFGTDVASDWRQGSPITWKGEWKGKAYQDKGVISRIERERLLEYTHFSPLSGLPDQPENYHRVTIELTDKGSQTLISLAQDNNPTEEGRKHSEKNWGIMLAALKTFVEK
jgi:uncharacterized protein YndB with AHSA1/START domain